MLARRTDEPHRVATVLELLFDLCFVVAVAQASDRLHHDLIEDHVWHGVTSYLLVFFAIWWAWMNFSWFASAYDADDVPYRLAVFVQIAGALVIAAGVPRAFDQRDFLVVTLGYVVMRLAGVAQWLRAAGSDPEHRRTALRFAVGVALLQVGWVARLAVPDELFLPSLLVLIAAELLVPIWAERANPTTWHPHHIAERYGLFTIIVLGETVLSASLAFQSAFDAGGGGSLLVLAGFGVVIVFAIWWLYFDLPGHERLLASRSAYLWGYGHYAIFASVAAVGAGLAVAADYHTHVSHLSRVGTGYAVAAPVAVFLLGLWALRLARVRPMLYPVTAALILATPLTPVPVPLTALLLAGLVAMSVVPGRSGDRRSTAGADQSTA
jgi:low temperature requirement protein LtrA